MKKDLVIIRAGANSSHGNWESTNRGFDLLVSAYEPLPPELVSFADEVIFIPGPKVISWRELFSQRPELLNQYEQIALLDDDLICSVADIEAVFAAGRKYSLSLWQPSLTWDSYFSYAISLHNPNFNLRYVNFIEMMCPFFSSGQLRLSLPLFSLGYETNIDRLWCRLRENPNHAYAILDHIQFRHSRAVGLNAAAQGFSHDPKLNNGNMYQSAIDAAESELGIFFRGPVAYAGETHDGKKINGRMKMAMLSLALFLARKKRVNKRFYRPILDHVRHNLTRPIDNERVDLPSLKPSGGL